MTKLIVAAILVLALAIPIAAKDRPVPQCERGGTGQMVDCYNADIINEAVRILREDRKQCADRDTLISYDANEGAFESAVALADFADGIGCLHGGSR